MTHTQRSRPGANGTASTLINPPPIVLPAGDTLLPVVAGIFCPPHRGRGLTLILALDCPHCHANHRHLTRDVRDGGLTRACPVTGRAYVVLRTSQRKAVRRG